MPIICPVCQKTVEPAAYTAEIFYCPECSQELSVDDVQQGEQNLVGSISKATLPKQKTLVLADEARERWRQAVAAQLGEPNWPEQTPEEKARWDAYMQRGTASNYTPWPEVDDASAG